MNDPLLENINAIKAACGFEPPPAPVEPQPEASFKVPYSLLADFEGGYLTWTQLLAELRKHAGVS